MIEFRRTFLFLSTEMGKTALDWTATVQINSEASVPSTVLWCLEMKRSPKPAALQAEGKEWESLLKNPTEEERDLDDSWTRQSARGSRLLWILLDRSLIITEPLAQLQKHLGQTVEETASRWWGRRMEGEAEQKFCLKHWAKLGGNSA